MERFIPTPVGNTACGSSAPSGSPVHPHACGEHIKLIEIRKKESGSSPRLWGTPSAPWPVTAAQRFIPTPVGNTLADLTVHVLVTVHPHACGEHSPGSRLFLEITGSSPRLWGTQSHRYGPRPSPRFIPTPVGNTHISYFLLGETSVHPHACGEHFP